MMTAFLDYLKHPTSLFLLFLAFAVPATAQERLCCWTSNAPKLSPEEGARILATSPGLSNRTNALAPLPDGPRVIYGPSSPYPFAFATLPPDRRLDGTLLTDPPANGYPVYYGFPIIASAPGWAWPWEERRPRR